MLWVTSAPLGLDGAASAWLIRRFVDPSPCFRVVEPDEMPLAARESNGRLLNPAAASGTRRQRRSAFEQLAHRYRPDDLALHHLGRLVGAASGGDAGRWTASAGLRLIGQGFSLVASDEEIVERSIFLYDALYAAVRVYPPVESQAARDARALAWFWLR